MYSFLIRYMKPAPAKIITALWYAGLILLVFLFANHAGKGDFIYLHL